MGVFRVLAELLGQHLELLGELGDHRLQLGLEQLLGRKILPEEIYYITEVPSHLIWSDVGSIVSVASEPELRNASGEVVSATDDDAVKNATQFIEPVMVVVMGIIIGFVAVALLMPIFSIGRVMAG